MATSFVVAFALVASSCWLSTASADTSSSIDYFRFERTDCVVLANPDEGPIEAAHLFQNIPSPVLIGWPDSCQDSGSDIAWSGARYNIKPGETHVAVISFGTNQSPGGLLPPTGASRALTRVIYLDAQDRVLSSGLFCGGSEGTIPPGASTLWVVPYAFRDRDGNLDGTCHGGLLPVVPVAQIQAWFGAYGNWPNQPPDSTPTQNRPCVWRLQASASVPVGERVTDLLTCHEGEARPPSSLPFDPGQPSVTTPETGASVGGCLGIYQDASDVNGDCCEDPIKAAGAYVGACHGAEPGVVPPGPGGGWDGPGSPPSPGALLDPGRPPSTSGSPIFFHPPSGSPRVDLQLDCQTDLGASYPYQGGDGKSREYRRGACRDADGNIQLIERGEPPVGTNPNWFEPGELPQVHPEAVGGFPQPPPSGSELVEPGHGYELMPSADLTATCWYGTDPTIHDVAGRFVSACAAAPSIGYTPCDGEQQGGHVQVADGAASTCGELPAAAVELCSGQDIGIRVRVEDGETSQCVTQR